MVNDCKHTEKIRINPPDSRDYMYCMQCGESVPMTEGEKVRAKIDADLQRRLDLAMEALNRVEPVLSWLESHGKESAGYSVAQQLRPYVDKALGK